MKLVKVCTISEMPEDIGNFIFNSGYPKESDFFPYYIGRFCDDVKASRLSIFENPQLKTRVENFTKLDDFLISQGATIGERVLIENY